MCMLRCHTNLLLLIWLLLLLLFHFIQYSRKAHSHNIASLIELYRACKYASTMEMKKKKHRILPHICSVWCKAKKKKKQSRCVVSLRLVEHPLSNNAHSITIFLLRYEWRMDTDWVLIAGQGTDILFLCRFFRVRMRVSLFSIAWCVSSFVLSFCPSPINFHFMQFHTLWSKMITFATFCCAHSMSLALDWTRFELCGIYKYLCVYRNICVW